MVNGTPYPFSVSYIWLRQRTFEFALDPSDKYMNSMQHQIVVSR